MSKRETRTLLDWFNSDWSMKAETRLAAELGLPTIGRLIDTDKVSPETWERNVVLSANTPQPTSRPMPSSEDFSIEWEDT